MARQKLTEYRGKWLLLGDGYPGISVTSPADPRFEKAGAEHLVVKVDQGVKKRFLKGLVAVDVSRDGAREKVREWMGAGYTSFIVEPLFPHEPTEEQYVSFERVRGGIRVIKGAGGVAVESDPNAVTTTLVPSNDFAALVKATSPIPESFVTRIQQLFDTEFVSFLEINPIVIRNGEAFPLDAAVMVDGAGSFFAKGWSEDDIPPERTVGEEEAKITALQKTTPASLKFSVLNPNGALWFLLSGGGGSIVILDGAHSNGLGKEIGNYGEYSGGPTREETHLYTREVLNALLKSGAPKKALVIAGGVANFTDVLKTFLGIMDAISERAPELRNAGIKVFVRRGGPNEKMGLEKMRVFLEKEGILGAVYGSGDVITRPVDDAAQYIKV